MNSIILGVPIWFWIIIVIVVSLAMFAIDYAARRFLKINLPTPVKVILSIVLGFGGAITYIIGNGL
ncbi:MAG TPA: hypothetical protein VHL11_09425, partial [Phototrophicaceae bacterium]|nr:hypothetical protein [Phototrophicaceae bacterium]